MKKVISLALALLFTAGGVCSAQIQTPDGRGLNEISLSYGRASIPGMVNTLAGLFGAMFSLGTAKPDNILTSGAIGFEYLRTVHPRVSVGFLATYEYSRLEFISGGKDGKPEKVSPSHMHYVSLMPAIKFPWFAKEHVSMYTKLAAGCDLTQTEAYTTENSDGTQKFHPASSKPMFACQVSPVGVDFGGQLCRGFVELGFGMQGLILGGVRFSL